MNGGRSAHSPKTRAWAGTWVALFAAFHAAGGCSAEGNEIPADPLPVDSGKRPVIGNEEGGSIKPASDAGMVVEEDSGSTTSDGGPTPGDSGSIGTCSFQTTTTGGTCTQSTDIGSVSGDSDPSINTLTFTGKGSHWISFIASEDTSGVTDADLSAKITLTGPAATNYDLYAYLDLSGTPTTKACATASGQSTNAAGTNDEVVLTWDDKKIGGNTDDTRIISVKIDHISGPCSTGDEWTLTVQGHPQ